MFCKATDVRHPLHFVLHPLLYVRQSSAYNQKQVRNSLIISFLRKGFAARCKSMISKCREFVNSEFLSSWILNYLQFHPHPFHSFNNYLHDFFPAWNAGRGFGRTFCLFVTFVFVDISFRLYSANYYLRDSVFGGSVIMEKSPFKIRGSFYRAGFGGTKKWNPSVTCASASSVHH